MNIFRKYLSTPLLRKVPEVTVFFWTIKLLTTAMGESTSDFLVHQIDPVLAVALGGIGFAIAIVLQLSVKKYVAWIYWLTLVMVAIFGTMAADVVHIVLGVPYVASALGFAVALILVFLIWYRTERTLSIHSISTPSRELFYWTAVIITFALGTAVGDMTAITFKWGYLTSGVVFAVLFALPLLAYYGFHAPEVLTFWASYIVTRPLGASFADWFGRSPASGGIGLGTGRASIVLTLLIVLFVAYLTITRKDIRDQQQLINEGMKQ